MLLLFFLNMFSRVRKGFYHACERRHQYIHKSDTQLVQLQYPQQMYVYLTDTAGVLFYVFKNARLLSGELIWVGTVARSGIQEISVRTDNTLCLHFKY